MRGYCFRPYKTRRETRGRLKVTDLQGLLLYKTPLTCSLVVIEMACAFCTNRSVGNVITRHGKKKISFTNIVRRTDTSPNPAMLFDFWVPFFFPPSGNIRFSFHAGRFMVCVYAREALTIARPAAVLTSNGEEI